MAAGLPVVASAVGGVVEEVLDGVTGFVVPPRDPRAFAAALRQLLTDKELRERLGAMGKEVVERDFNLDGFRSAHIELYQQLLQTGELPTRSQEEPRVVEAQAPAEAPVLVSSR
jgi:glycosyltransferase involved in cell wall biosynthesis